VETMEIQDVQRKLWEGDCMFDGMDCKIMPRGNGAYIIWSIVTSLYQQKVLLYNDKKTRTVTISVE